MEYVVTVTLNPAVDITSEAERFRVGHKTRCAPEQRTPGGGGINVARGIQLLGGRAEAWYSKGGATGELLAGLLADDGVPARPVSISGPVRENVAIRERASGELYHFVFPGPTFQRSDWEGWLEALAGFETRPRYLVLSGSLPPGVPEDFYARVTRALPDDVRVVLDSSGPALDAAVSSGGLHVLKVNEREFRHLTGAEPAEDYAGYLGALETLSRAGCADAVIVTVGAHGALLQERGARALHIRPPAIEGVSPVGAGDSFTAAMTHRLCEGAEMVEAVTWGVAAAAAAVRVSGSELYRSDDIARIHARIPEPRPAAVHHG